ncbi:probable basic-leucine zipper transcription factor Q [Zerene cesonia]|uniref:probable basic-leucine zipper transcription factor Q n=1 Tax=Zerene cesonia TaxID=33412 RepID=UPI0018E5438F|nr:probable basic-leucine zipper transcription factor Q [Zerene cesonia]
MYRVIVLLCAIHVSHGFLCLRLRAQVAELQQHIAALNTRISNDRAATTQQINRLQQESNERIRSTETQLNQCIEKKIQWTATHQQLQIAQQAKLAAQDNATQAANQCQQQLSALQQQITAMKEHNQELKKQIERDQQKFKLEQESVAQCQQQLQQQIAWQQQQEQQLQQKCALEQEIIKLQERAQYQQQLNQQLDLQKKQENTMKEQEQQLQKLRNSLLELEKLSSPSKMSPSEAFDRLGSFLSQLAPLQCNIEASEIVSPDSYKLTYDLPINLEGDDIEVKIKNRVIYVRGSKGGTVVFEHVELLPAALDAKSADWQLQGDKIEIFIPFNKTQTGTKRDPCKADNSTITVQESSPMFTFRNKISV